MEDMWAKKVELPDFVGIDPIGGIDRAEKFFEEHEIYPSDMLQRAFMSMEGEKQCFGFNLGAKRTSLQTGSHFPWLFRAQMEYLVEKLMLGSQETNPDSWKVVEIRDETVLDVAVLMGMKLTIRN
ncbi:hypothetical protein CR513_33101, partial [Mucuna pruriens]